MAQAAVKDTTGYVNYVYNISARGTTEVASQLLGLSGMATNILGQLAFQTSSYLSTTEGALLSMGVIATAGFTKATQQAMEFDQALSTVGAISGKTRGEVASLGDDAMAMSNKFGVAVNEMTQGMESLARAGVSQNNMTAILEEAMGLSKLEGLTLDTAINDLISTTNLLDTQNLDLSSSDYADAVRYQNQKITATSEAAPINAQDIIHTLEHIGGYASSTNLDQDDLYAVIAQLGSKGTKSEMAGTSLRAFISAGQKDTAQRALNRIGLNVKDLWKNDDTIMSISDMKDVLDEAMESRGYTQQEKLEFYSDFAGYKQANQIMKIDTSSVREFKEKIDHSWNMGQKINQVIGTAETHVQGLVQAGTNLLTKVGEPFLPIISTIAWTLRTGIDIINAIPGSNLIIAGGLILASVKAISTIFNKIVPQIVAAKGNIGSMGGFFDSIKRDLKESYTIIKNINNTDWIQRQAHSNEVNHVTDDDKIKYWQHRTGKRLYGITDVYRLERRHGFTNDQHYIDWKRRENYRTKESRNERHETQNEPTGATESSDNRKDNKKSDCCDSIIQVMKEGFVNQIYNTNTIKDRVSDIYGILSNSVIDKSVIDDLKTNVFSVYVTNIGDGGFSGGGSRGSQSDTPSQTTSSQSSTSASTSTSSTKSKPRSSTKLLTNGVLDQSKIDSFIDNLDIDFGFDQSTVAGRESQKLMLNYAKDILRDNFRNNRNKLTGQSEEQLKKRIDREIKESIGPAAAHKLPSILASDPNIKTYSSSDLDKMTAYPTIDYDPSLKSSNDVLSELNLDYTRLTRGDNALKGGQEYLTALASLGNVNISNVKQNRNFRSNVAKQIAEDLKNGKNKDDIYSAKAVLDNVLTNRVAYHYINDLNDSDRKKFMESVGLKQTENPYVDMANYINANLNDGGEFVNKPEHLDLIHNIGNIAYLDKDKLKVTGGFSSYGNFPNSQSVKNEIDAGTEKAIKMIGETGYYGIANHIKKITDAIVELAIQEDIEETRKEMEKELDRKVSTSEVIRSMPSLAQPNRFKWKPNDYDDIGKISPDVQDLSSTIFNAAQQMHDDNIGGNEKYKNSTEGSKYAQLERTKLVQVDKGKDFIYFEKEREELKNLSLAKLLSLVAPPEISLATEDIGPHKVGGNNTGTKNPGVSELEALPFIFEGQQIKGVFKRLPTHGRDMQNTAVMGEEVVGTYLGKDIVVPQLQGYLRNDKGRYHEAYSWALQQKRNREMMQRNQSKVFGNIALNYGLSRQQIMDLPLTQLQEDRINLLYNQQDFVNIEQYKKHYQDLYDAATPEQQKMMMTGDEALRQLRGQMAAARKVDIGKNGEVIDNGSMFEIEVTPEEYRRRKDANLIYTDEGNEGILKIRKDKNGKEFYTINDFESLHYSYNDIKRRVLLEDVLRAKELESTYDDTTQIGDSYLGLPSDNENLAEFLSANNITQMHPTDIAGKIMETPKENIKKLMYAIYLFDKDVYSEVLKILGDAYPESAEDYQQVQKNKTTKIDKAQAADMAFDLVYGYMGDFVDSLTPYDKDMIQSAENPMSELLMWAQIKGGISPDVAEKLGKDSDLIREFNEAMNVGSLDVDVENERIGINSQSVADVIDQETRADIEDFINGHGVLASPGAMSVTNTETVWDRIKEAINTDFDEQALINYRGVLNNINAIQNQPLDGNALNIIAGLKNIPKYYDPNLVWKETTPGGDEEPTILNPINAIINDTQWGSGGKRDQYDAVNGGQIKSDFFFDSDTFGQDPLEDKAKIYREFTRNKLRDLSRYSRGEVPGDKIAMSEHGVDITYKQAFDTIMEYMNDQDGLWEDSILYHGGSLLTSDSNGVGSLDKIMSTSFTKNVAEDFVKYDKDYMTKIYAPQGTQGLYTDNMGEDEYTLGHGQIFIELSRDDENKTAEVLLLTNDMVRELIDNPLVDDEIKQSLNNIQQNMQESVQQNIQFTGLPGGISGLDYSTIQLVNQTLDMNSKSIQGYQTVGQFKEAIQQKLDNFISPKVDRLYGRFGDGDNSKITERLGGWSDKLTDATDTLQGFSVYLQEASELFPPLSIAVLGLEGVITTVTKINEGTQALSSFLSIGDRLKSGDEIEFLGKMFSSDSNVGKMLISATGMVGEAVETLTTIFWEFLGPIALITAGLIAIKGALDWSYQSHQKYLKSLEEDQKEHRSKVKGLQATNENAQEQARNNRAPRQQAAFDRNAQLAQTRLDNANMTRSHGAIEITRQKNDTLWGDYGIAAGLGKLQGNYESTASEYDGTTGQIRRIKEATLANPFSSEAMNQVSSYYDANQLAFGIMDEYKDELGKLYDSETSAMLKYHSDDVRGSPEFNKALDDFVEATGITRDHAKQYLDYMQTEHEVDKATQAMQAQADQISANTELKVQAIAFGGNPADVLGLNGIEAQQGAMIKAQADMVKMELSGQLWWKAVWSTITTPIKLILSPLFIITDLLSAIWSFMTGNWGDAFDKAGKAGSRLNVFGEAATYWGAWAETEGTDFNAIGQGATDSYNRANYGNVEQPASGGYHPTHYIDSNQGQDRREAFTHYTDANRGSYHFMNAGGPGQGGSGIQFNPLGTITGLLSSILGVLVNGLLIGGGIYGIYKLIKSDFSFKALGEGILSTIKGEGSNLLYDIFNVESINGKATDILGKFFNLDGIKGLGTSIKDRTSFDLIKNNKIYQQVSELIPQSIKDRFGNVKSGLDNAASNWSSYIHEKVNPYLPSTFSKKKRKGMNAADREYLMNKYGLNEDEDIKNARTSYQKNKLIRQKLDEQGNWDSAMRDLQYHNTIGQYTEPWKEYLGGKVDKKKTQAKDYLKRVYQEAQSYSKDPETGDGASLPAKILGQGLYYKDRIFGKASETDFGALINNPAEFLSDPRNIEKMGKDIYSNYKDKYQKAKEDPAAQEEYDWYKEGGAMRFMDLSRENKIRAIGDKLSGIKTGMFGMEEGESVREMLKNPERTMEVLQNARKSIQENGWMESLGLDEDFGISDAVKDKVSGFFDKIKEGAEEGIDDDEKGGKSGLIERAKKKLAGLFGFGKEKETPESEPTTADKDPNSLKNIIKNKDKDPKAYAKYLEMNKLDHDVGAPLLGNEERYSVLGGEKPDEFANMSYKERIQHMKDQAEIAKARMGGPFIKEETPGAMAEEPSIIDIADTYSISDIADDFGMNKGGSIGDIINKVGGGKKNPLSKIGQKGKGALGKLGGKKGIGGVGKLAKGGIGKAVSGVGGKAISKIGSKLASKGIAQIGSKVLGGALIASGIGAPLGLLLESPLGGMLIEGAMDLGGKALGAIGGAASGLLGGIGGLLGFGKKTHYQQAGGSGGLGALGALMPGIGIAGLAAGGIGAAAGGVFGLLNGIFKSNKDIKGLNSSMDGHLDKTVKAITDKKSAQQSNNGQGGSITIQNININTADDPEAIKAMFLELLIELQEQVNPRIVSRTIGQSPTNSSTTTDTSSTDISSTDTSTTNENQNNNGTNI